MLLFLAAFALVVQAQPVLIGVDPGDDKNMTHLVQNSCNTFASDKDMQNTGLSSAVANFCNNHFHHKVDAVHVNADGYPYKMCLIAKQATWTGLQPASATRVMDKDSFTNDNSQSVSHTFTLGGKTSQSATISTTTTVSLSTSVSYEVSVEKVFTDKFTLTTSFSSSRTESHSDTNEVSYQSSTTISAHPGCTYVAELTSNLQVYNSHFKVPLCVDGYARCQFDSAIADPTNPAAGKHYWWYFDIRSLGLSGQACFIQNGGLGASISIDSNSNVSSVGKNC